VIRVGGPRADLSTDGSAKRLDRGDAPPGHQHDLDTEAAAELDQARHPQVGPAALEPRNLRLGEPDSLAQLALADTPGLAQAPELKGDLLDGWVHGITLLIYENI